MDNIDTSTITFDRKTFRDSVFSAIGGRLPEGSGRLRSLVLARSFAVQVTLDTLRPVLVKILESDGELPTAGSVTVSKAKLYRGRKALVFTDAGGPVSVALAQEGGGSFKVATFGKDGVTAEMAVEALGTFDMRREFFSTQPEADGRVELYAGPAGMVSGSVDAAIALARFVRSALPEETAIAIGKAREATSRYLTQEGDNPFLTATSAALDEDGMLAGGFTKECLDILWKGSLTAEFASRLAAITELTDSLLATDAVGPVGGGNAWAVEENGVQTIVVGAWGGNSLRIDRAEDRLTASVADCETGTKSREIGEFQIRGDRLSPIVTAPYDGNLCHRLHKWLDRGLDGPRVQAFPIQNERATSPSP